MFDFFFPLHCLFCSHQIHKRICCRSCSLAFQLQPATETSVSHLFKKSYPIARLVGYLKHHENPYLMDSIGEFFLIQCLRRNWMITAVQTKIHWLKPMKKKLLPLISLQGAPLLLSDQKVENFDGLQLCIH